MKSLSSPRDYVPSLWRILQRGGIFLIAVTIGPTIASLITAREFNLAAIWSEVELAFWGAGLILSLILVVVAVTNLYYLGGVNGFILFNQAAPTDSVYELKLFGHFFEDKETYYPGTIYFSKEKIRFQHARLHNGQSWEIQMSDEVTFGFDRPYPSARTRRAMFFLDEAKPVLTITANGTTYHIETPFAKEVKADLEDYYGIEPIPLELEASTATEIDWVAMWRQKRAEDSHPTAS